MSSWRDMTEFMIMFRCHSPPSTPPKKTTQNKTKTNCCSTLSMINDTVPIPFQNKGVKNMGVWGTPCEWIVLDTIQKAALAQPVKTQIAARLIVVLGSAPELGFVRTASTITGKWNSNTNWNRGEYFHPAGWGWCDSGVMLGEEMSLGRWGET